MTLDFEMEQLDRLLTNEGKEMLESISEHYFVRKVAGVSKRSCTAKNDPHRTFLTFRSFTLKR